jgi:hypothetical protein
VVERRRHARIRRRLGCRIRLGERRASAIVLDFSLGGLFVQCQASLRPGEDVEVEIEPPSEATVRLETVVARRRQVPAQLLSVARGGLGLSIPDPPDGWVRLVEASIAGAGAAGPAPGSAPRPDAPRPADEPAWSVRVQQRGSPRTRALRAHAPDPEEARRRVEARLGDDWHVIHVDAA